MKTPLNSLWIGLAWLAGVTMAFTQGTAFTYQGRLVENNQPANGQFDFRFTLYDSASGGRVMGDSITNSGMALSNGLLTATLDFGDGVFGGRACWLEIGVRRSPKDDFIPLSPRQAITAAPYAIVAGNLGRALTTADLADGSVTVPKLADDAVTTAKIAPGTILNADIAAGAAIADSKLGTIQTPGKVANQATTATSANTPNAIVARNGSGGFSAGAIAATGFSGDGGNLSNLDAAQLSRGTVPDARLDGNLARTNQVWLLGGNGGTSRGLHFLGTTDDKPLELRVNRQRVLRFEDNGDSFDGDRTADGAPNVLAGSSDNLVGQGAVGVTIGGGGATNFDGTSLPQTVLADYSTVGGGLGNRVAEWSVFSTVAGGYGNTIASNASGSAVGGGSFNVVDQDSFNTVIAGGRHNYVGTNSNASAIGGGLNNGLERDSSAGVVAGGERNGIGANSGYSTVSGGYRNLIRNSAGYSAIGGGGGNDIGIMSGASAIAGGYYNRIADNSWNGSIGGGHQNHIGLDSPYGTIGGGYTNAIADDSWYGAIGGGRSNQIGGASEAASIAGGQRNLVMYDADGASIGGGQDNVIDNNSEYGTIGGGYLNKIKASNSSSVIGGGIANLIGTNANFSAIGGGTGNVVTDNGAYAAIPGGNMNQATNYGFAAGHRARAIHSGAFVWSDGAGTVTESATNNSVTMRARGGFRFLTGSGSGGAELHAGATSWSVLSDRNLKKDFTPMDSRVILEKLAAVPITQWHYQWERGEDTPHIGPMAQEFKAAFYPGRDDRHITTQEADGVALAAIQGLNRKVEAEAAALRVENLELKRELAEIKQTLADLLNRQTSIGR